MGWLPSYKKYSILGLVGNGRQLDHVVHLLSLQRVKA
jgi:hypothetical protein